MNQSRRWLPVALAVLIAAGACTSSNQGGPSTTRLNSYEHDLTGGITLIGADDCPNAEGFSIGSPAVVIDDHGAKVGKGKIESGDIGVGGTCLVAFRIPRTRLTEGAKYTVQLVGTARTESVTVTTTELAANDFRVLFPDPEWVTSPDFPYAVDPSPR